ncbi:hypothetical protein FRB90_005288 [Tulasnella sp. 427]|nr:hypothetical protein FRB90_005288 [Tulasnella sp. 427]
MTLKILVGGYTSIITALLYTPNGSGTGSLSQLSQSNAGTNPSWLALNPSNSSILFANQETDGGSIWSFEINPTTAALKKKSAGSTGGNAPAHFAVLSGGGNEIVAANYASASTIDMVLKSDRKTFSSTTGPMITYTGSGPNSGRQSAPHPHQVIEYIANKELLINDLGSDKTWRLSRSSSGAWTNSGYIQHTAGSGPRHGVTLDGNLYTLHELSNTLTQRTLPALGSSTASRLIATLPVIPPGADNSTLFAAELLLSPKNCMYPTQYLYATNRQDTDPNGDTIAIFSLNPLKLVKHVRTGLKAIRGAAIGGPNGEYLVAGGQNGGGVVLYKRTSGGAALTELARYSNLSSGELKSTSSTPSHLYNHTATMDFDNSDFLLISTLSMDDKDTPTPKQATEPPAAQDPTPTESTKPTFSGKPDESLMDFLQAIQKLAFDQDRVSDERWIAGYVGTCLTGDALLWYTTLDDRSRNSWFRLRKALVNRFPPQLGPTPTLTSGMIPMRHASTGPMLSPSFGGPPIPEERNPNELKGRIEIFAPEKNLWLGYMATLYVNVGTICGVGTDKDTANLVTFVPDQDGKPFQLSHGNMTPADFNYPYMGVALDEPGSTQVPQPSIPPFPYLAPPAPQFTGYPPPGSLGCSCRLGCPIPPSTLPPMSSPFSPAVQPVQPQPRSEGNEVPTWSIKPCTESRKDARCPRASKTNSVWEKAAAAVWTYDPESKEMGIVWLNDDGSEEKLNFFVSKPTPGSFDYNTRLFLQKAQDGASVVETSGDSAPQPQKFPVKLFFVPEE